jgi:trans-2,3-dihydro-3-hydroxyanthranilate isomerase
VIGALDVWLVDAFTREPGTGNPAAVVLEATGLADEVMRRIAANFPATSFVLPPSRPGHEIGLRWFTATGAELRFCGHGTVAAVHALCESGRLTGNRIAFDTAAGGLPATIDGELVWLEPALPACVPSREPLDPVLEALRIGAEAVGAWAPVARTGEGDLLIPAAGLDVLKTLAPDPGRLAGVARERAIRGFCVTSRETVSPDAATHSRFFAPHLGIPEDPTTGSVHAALPVWLWEAGALQGTGSIARLRAEQGDFMGRPGRLAVELHLDGGRPARVRVGGEAVTVLTGRLPRP